MYQSVRTLHDKFDDVDDDVVGNDLEEENDQIWKLFWKVYLFIILLEDFTTKSCLHNHALNTASRRLQPSLKLTDLEFSRAYIPGG